MKRELPDDGQISASGSSDFAAYDLARTASRRRHQRVGRDRAYASRGFAEEVGHAIAAWGRAQRVPFACCLLGQVHDRYLPCEQRPPTTEHEARHPKHRGNHVDRNEHAKEQRVVDEGSGAPVDRDGRYRALGVFHEIKQRASQHQIQLVEQHAGGRYPSLGEDGVAHARPGQDADKEAHGGEGEQCAQLLDEAHDQSPIEANLNLRGDEPEDHSRQQRRGQAAERDGGGDVLGERREQIAARPVDMFHGRSYVWLRKRQHAARVDVVPVGLLDQRDRFGPDIAYSGADLLSDATE